MVPEYVDQVGFANQIAQLIVSRNKMVQMGTIPVLKTEHEFADRVGLRAQIALLSVSPRTMKLTVIISVLTLVLMYAGKIGLVNLTALLFVFQKITKMDIIPVPKMDLMFAINIGMVLQIAQSTVNQEMINLATTHALLEA